MFKSVQSWIKDGAAEAKTAIDSNGTWQLADTQQIRSDVLSRIYFSSQAADASGATVAVGIRTKKGLTPIPVVAGSKTLAGLATGQDNIEVDFRPMGNICITVTGYVAPIVVEVVQ